MAITNDVRLAWTFVAVIHKKNVADKKRFDVIVNECRIAKAMGKPMYAIIEKGLDPDVLGDMPWKKMVHFNNASEIPGILNFIDGDIRAGGFYT